MQASRFNSPGSTLANLPVRFSKTRLSNRFDQLLLNNPTSRSSSYTRENLPSQTYQPILVGNSTPERRLQTKYSAHNFKLEQTDGRIVERSQQRTTIGIERGSLTQRRVNLYEGSTGTPVLGCPTESGDGDEMQLDPITHTLANENQELERESMPKRKNPQVSTAPRKSVSDRTQRLLMRPGSQSTAFTEASAGRTGAKVKPLFKHPIASKFKGKSVAQISKQLKQNYSKGRQKVIVSDSNALQINRQASTQQISQPMMEQPPNIFVTTESMFLKQQQKQNQSNIQSSAKAPAPSQATTINTKTQQSFHRSSYSARFLQAQQLGGGSQPTFGYVPHAYPSQSVIEVTSNLIPSSASRTSAKKCTLQDNRCFGLGCKAFSRVDEYELMPLDEHGHNREPIFR